MRKQERCNYGLAMILGGFFLLFLSVGWIIVDKTRGKDVEKPSCVYITGGRLTIEDKGARYELEFGKTLTLRKVK